MENTFRVDALSDDDLLSRTVELIARGRRLDARLIAHMAEVDGRRLYLREACSSMFSYATERLGLSECQAYDRITVARTSRRFPGILEMLSDGRLTLTAAARLGPHLTVENAEALLARTVHATKRQVEVLIAEVAPKPDVPSLVRRLPAPAAVEVLPAGPAVVDPVPAPAILVPIAPARFKVQFTASAELEAKITRARALLRHQNPTGDLAAIVDRAMTMLLDDLERKKCAATERPRKSVSQAKTAASSRYIPAPVRRAVWQRDDGCCTFVDACGRRCSARERLEIHHVIPFARRGEHTVENLRLLCGSHNGYQAELDYGRDLIDERRRRGAGG